MPNKQVPSAMWWAKHRPTKLKDLALPSLYKRRIINMANRKSIPNLLFYGRPGLGKSLTAELLQKACTDRVCRFSYAGEYWLTTERLKFLAETARTGISSVLGTSVVVVDDADKMSIDGQKILLGIIDRYHERMRFILTTNHPDQLYDSLVSRCEEFDFDQVGEDEIQHCLDRVVKLENVQLPDESYRSIIVQCRNDIRKAIQLLEQEADMLDSDSPEGIAASPE